ncbi:MAG: YHS domain-containing protein [Candidatus Marinimicrobia bacterium]|nr:YHS domain-containing protein [Candidatus Neomarinimicrobiota bacterium]MCF7829772.1 YHS domain-containing protein [Candidatus Neomarinimicrobiota bacterium]MCF7881722.1 YHS domain-containing protein [Candidatus Neomarinimicrobiota bacterium]
MHEDPVCKMPVDGKHTYYLRSYKGTTYYFCCSSCKAKFEEDPARYLSQSDENNSGRTPNMTAE